MPLHSFDQRLERTFTEAVHALGAAAMLVEPTTIPDALYTTKGEKMPRQTSGLVFYWKKDALIVAHVRSE